ncbi:MAG: SufE family protein [Chlamydiota bacterium]|nr:SufE family protein [Chlamydiota bacterium]
MFDSCLKKQQQIKELFSACSNQEEKYEKIIELGKKNTSLSEEYKTKENYVHGCQSTMYLHSLYEGGKVYFEAESDALISSGLAVLLIDVYSGESPETILKCEPNYLEELGVSASLTPSRANGLYSIHLRMKQDALKFLMGKGA